jgi:hypothetical protein
MNSGTGFGDIFESNLAWARSKLQTPRSREIPSSNPQVHYAPPALLEFGSWSLDLLWILDLECWILVLDCGLPLRRK